MGDDFVARANTKRHEHKPDRIGSVSDAYRIFAAEVLGKFPFELFQHWPKHILSAFKHFLNFGVDFTLDVVILPDVSIERCLHCKSPFLCFKLQFE